MNVEYDLVRLYFEENGFWVRQGVTYSETIKKAPFSHFSKSQGIQILWIVLMEAFVCLQAISQDLTLQLSLCLVGRILVFQQTCFPVMPDS